MFAVLFLRALLGYLRRRDPLQRDVTLVFAPCTVLFCVDIARRLNHGNLPTWVAASTLTVLLAQPYLTVGWRPGCGAVPRWLHLAVLAAFLAGGPSRRLRPAAADRAGCRCAVVGFCLSSSSPPGCSSARPGPGPARTGPG